MPLILVVIKRHHGGVKTQAAGWEKVLQHLQLTKSSYLEYL